MRQKAGYTRTQQKNDYNARAYDRINIVVPKGQKAAIQAAAEQVGESINGYVNGAVLARMGLEEWPEAQREDNA